MIIADRMLRVVTETHGQMLNDNTHRLCPASIRTPQLSEKVPCVKNIILDIVLTMKENRYSVFTISATLQTYNNSITDEVQGY